MVLGSASGTPLFLPIANTVIRKNINTTILASAFVCKQGRMARMGRLHGTGFDGGAKPSQNEYGMEILKEQLSIIRVIDLFLRL